MAAAFATAAIVLMALSAVLVLPRLQGSLLPALRHRLATIGGGRWPTLPDDFDPGRELRAEQRARSLLRSCINEEEWAMYHELGFLRVWGALAERPPAIGRGVAPLFDASGHSSPTAGLSAAPYAYLINPHRPILAYLPHTGVLLGEYCVEFPDRTRPYGSSRLPAGDDLLAKWMALRTDEGALLDRANMHLPGRQISLAEARRDLVRLACWERERLQSQRRSLLRDGSVPAR
jgi:hypothetical protein